LLPAHRPAEGSGQLDRASPPGEQQCPGASNPITGAKRLPAHHRIPRVQQLGPAHFHRGGEATIAGRQSKPSSGATGLHSITGKTAESNRCQRITGRGEKPFPGAAHDPPAGIFKVSPKGPRAAHPIPPQPHSYLLDGEFWRRPALSFRPSPLSSLTHPSYYSG